MLRELKIKWITWIDGVNLSKEELQSVLSNYDFHELDLEAVLEPNQTARIDSYDDYMFLTLHFPKYNSRAQFYSLNEFHVFLWKDFIITLRDFEGQHLDGIFQKYEQKQIEEYDLDVSTWLILYEVIQVMLEKMFKVRKNIRKDIKEIEEKVFKKASSPLVKDIMIKKRNIIVLKHMFQPQKSVLIGLENHMKKIFPDEIEVYFEDLEDKLEKIITDVKILEEYIESVEDAFKSIIDIKTNSTIKFLTIFSAILLPLTLITSFYGMNINLPFQETPGFVYGLLFFSIWVVLLGYMYFNKQRKM